MGVSLDPNPVPATVGSRVHPANTPQISLVQALHFVASTAFMAYFVKYRLGPTWLLLQTFMGLIGFSLIFGGGVFNVKAPNGMP